MIKVKKRKILLLPGDGIGPEVISEVQKIIEWFNKNKSLDFEIEEGLVGGASFEKHKTPIHDEVFYKALESEAVILGAVGGPTWDNLEFSKRPERALLKLRKELKLFANLRPAICFKQLVDASSLKPEIISGFRGDASTSCLKQIAGLKFANNFNSFLSFKRALSGLLENSKLSHLGPPTAPSITASLSRAL